MRNDLVLFQDYARSWVRANIPDISEQEELIRKINELPQSVSSHIDERDIDDYLRCVYVIISGYSDWLGLGTLKAYFPLDPSEGPHAAEMHQNKEMLESKGIPAEIVAHEDTISEFKSFLSYLSELAVHYSDIKSGKKELVCPEVGEELEEHYRGIIIESGYGYHFLPVWLICRGMLFSERKTAFDYVGILWQIEHFIGVIYVKFHHPKDFFREQFCRFACEVGKGGPFRYLPWEVSWDIEDELI